MEPYEQYEEVRPFWGWVMVIALSAVVCGWTMVLPPLMPEVKRQWDFGQLPTTPAESVYSTQQPPAAQPAPAQVEPLPEARHSPRELAK